MTVYGLQGIANEGVDTMSLLPNIAGTRPDKCTRLQLGWSGLGEKPVVDLHWCRGRKRGLI